MKFDPAGLTAAQIRAARQLIGWHAIDLAEKSGVGVATIRRAELCDGVTDMKPENAEKIVKAFARHGLIFYGTRGDWGPGVRMKR
jgi:transcriptional regulator with XRE-family HTH domain